MTKPFRCHDADACAGGFNQCPMPWACGVEPPKKIGFFRRIFDAFIAPSCCEVNGVASCQQGRSCPVRDGTHKPAEALHQIQEPKQ